MISISVKRLLWLSIPTKQDRNKNFLVRLFSCFYLKTKFRQIRADYR